MSIGKRKIKPLNWLALFIFLLLCIYLIGTLICLLPSFKHRYNYVITKENYKLNLKTEYKTNWFKCNITKTYEINSNDKIIKRKIIDDLKSDGFKQKNNKFVKKEKVYSSCNDEYKKYSNINKVAFKLNGKSNIKLNYNEKYNEEYVTFKGSNRTNNVTISSNLNERQIGDYVITYTLNIDNLYKERLYRRVSIVDNEEPVIKLLGDKDMTLEYASLYNEPGYIATDNYDGDITKKVKIKNDINSKKTGTYKVIYTVYDSSNNKSIITRNVTVKEKIEKVSKGNSKIEVKDGITYVNGILLVNKDYGLPKDYNPGVNLEAMNNLKNMQSAASIIGLNISLVSGFRSYNTQSYLYDNYVKKDGVQLASTYSAKPGYSEHQTGLAFDVGSTKASFANTNEAKWIEENAHLYGFIVRYPKGKTNITGYIYEPWHIRYLGKEIATSVKESNLTLEEYLGIK